MSSLLFSPLKIRELELKNRIVVSPMCQYSAKDGVPNTWHLVHLGSRAVGGAAVVFTEATGVSPEGRISPADLGIWNEEQTKSFAEITEFIKSNRAIPAIQLAHAGRKASKSEPWKGDETLPPTKGGWMPLAPSPLAFNEASLIPIEMNTNDMNLVTVQFALAAKNALKAGFEILEIHMAHGYLLHEFLSPLTNLRKDGYGGSLENRMRFPLQIADTLRKLWPTKWPVFVRISASDWSEGGWDLQQSITFSEKLKELGIDLIDCSSGGIVPNAKINAGPGYQVPFCDSIRNKGNILAGAVGVITEAKQAEDILQKGQADLIFMAREFLRDPYWPLHAAKVLNVDLTWPKQYERAKKH